MASAASCLPFDSLLLSDVPRRRTRPRRPVTPLSPATAAPWWDMYEFLEEMAEEQRLRLAPEGEPALRYTREECVQWWGDVLDHVREVVETQTGTTWP